MECNRSPASSKWQASSEVLHVVLPQYLEQRTLLTARLVCRAWCTAFAFHVKELHLTRLQNTEAALLPEAASHQAAAFANARVVTVDLQCSPLPEKAVALLRPLRKLRSLQELRLQLITGLPCRCLPASLPLLPQLQVLDLTGCFHRSGDLLVIAKYLKQLQQLLLHCPRFTTLSGRVMGDWRTDGWERVGGVVRYHPQHIAALAQLPRLRVLECTVPTVCGQERQMQWLAAVATLTQLTALHIIQGHMPEWPLPAGHLSKLSSLTALRNLSTDAGAPKKLCWANRGQDNEARKQAQLQAQQWSVALSGMAHLTRLELVRVLLCDQLLSTIGSAAPQLRELHLDLASIAFAASTSTEGAAAAAHIPRIELTWNKGLHCSSNSAVMQLPNIRMMRHRFLNSELRDIAWSADNCICFDGVYKRGG